jgi:hypothetical protein
MGDPVLTITTARVETAGGRIAALIAMVDVGGGEQVVTVDGAPEVRVHPSSRVYHVTLLSPDRMVPDQLREAPSYQDACVLGITYAEKLAEHAARVDALAADLKV